MRRLGAFATTLSSVPITLFGLVLITFLIGRVVPIDPVLAVVGDRAPQDVVEATRHAMGLDQPLPIQFVHYVSNLLHGDLGRSVMTSHTVTTDIATVLPRDDGTGDDGNPPRDCRWNTPRRPGSGARAAVGPIRSSG